MDTAEASQIHRNIASSSLVANMELNCELILDAEKDHSTINADPELKKAILDFLAAL